LYDCPACGAACFCTDGFQCVHCALQAERTCPACDGSLVHLAGDEYEPPPRQRVGRGTGVTQVLRQLQFATLAEGRDWRAVTCRSASWKDSDRTTIAAGFGAHGRTDIVLGPVLGTLEREILAAPRQPRPWRIRVAAGAQPEIDPPWWTTPMQRAAS
jgi:hypothetical protein